MCVYSQWGFGMVIIYFQNLEFQNKNSLSLIIMRLDKNEANICAFYFCFLFALIHPAEVTHKMTSVLPQITL